MGKRKNWAALLGLATGMMGAYQLARWYRQNRGACPPFRKRIYRASEELIGDFGRFWYQPAWIWRIRTNPQLTGSFITKLMLAVSGANGGRYSNDACARYARKQGLEDKQIISLLQGDVSYATVDEAPALFYARHYAETLGRPDPDIAEQLVKHYGQRTADDISHLVQLLMLGNLLGNTLDALISRILGKPAEKSSLVGELGVIAVGALGIGPLLPVLLLRAAKASRS